MVTALPGRAQEPAAPSPLMEQVCGMASKSHHETFGYGAAGERWGDALTRWTPSGRAYVGATRSGEVLNFNIHGLENHRALLVRVKLFVIYHWDGNWTVYGPDLFRVQLDQSQEWLRTTFSNFRVVGQSFPDDWPWGDHSARTAAVETGTLGWKFPGGWGEPLDAVYDIWLGAVRQGSSLHVEFRGDFHDARDPMKLRGEQWGIETLEIHTFDQPLELPQATWRTLAENLLSADAAKAAEARALLPLGDGEAVCQALDATAARHALDRPSLEQAARRAEAEPNHAETLADALERTADALRRRDAKDDALPQPSQACRASRLYHALNLMGRDPQWRSLLWQEMNRTPGS